MYILILIAVYSLSGYNNFIFTFTILQSEILSCPGLEEDEDIEYENVDYLNNIENDC